MLEEWAEILKKVEGRKADLGGADLSYHKLMKAQLQGANLSGADLSYAYLMQADLTNADLSGVDFNSAVLSEANLNGANLEDADFTEAYLCGVDLSQTLNLTCDQLDLAYLDRATRLPGHMPVSNYFLNYLNLSTHASQDQIDDAGEIKKDPPEGRPGYGNHAFNQ